MNKGLVTAALAAGIMISITGCDTGPACIRGHYEYVPMTQYNPTTKATTVQLMPVYYCDKYETTPEKES